MHCQLQCIVHQLPPGLLRHYMQLHLQHGLSILGVSLRCPLHGLLACILLSGMLHGCICCKGLLVAEARP